MQRRFKEQVFNNEKSIRQICSIDFIVDDAEIDEENGKTFEKPESIKPYKKGGEKK